MELSNFEETVVHLANTRVVDFTIERAKTSGEKTAASAVKMFLGEAVKSGALVEYVRKHELERRGVMHGK